MNMHCMLFRSSSQKFPTQSLFANVLWQAKLFLLKKEAFEVLCSKYTCSADSSFW